MYKKDVGFWTKIRANLKWLIVIIILIPICWFISNYIVFSYIDPTYCIPKIANRLNVPSDWGSIAAYAKSSMKSGMTKAEVIKILNNIGPTNIRETSEDKENHEILENYEVKLCWNVSNDLDIGVNYSQDYFLKSFNVDMHP